MTDEQRIAEIRKTHERGGGIGFDSVNLLLAALDAAMAEAIEFASQAAEWGRLTVEQEKRAEAAEARIAELEGALDSAALEMEESNDPMTASAAIAVRKALASDGSKAVDVLKAAKRWAKARDNVTPNGDGLAGEAAREHELEDAEDMLMATVALLEPAIPLDQWKRDGNE